MFADQLLFYTIDSFRLFGNIRLLEGIKLLEQAAEEFNQMTLDKDVPKVGIVGEIFLKFNPFAHQYLERYIISKGIEVVPPLLAPFFLQEFVNVEIQKHRRG